MRYAYSNNRNKSGLQSALITLIIVLLARGIYSDTRHQPRQDDAIISQVSAQGDKNQARDSSDKQSKSTNNVGNKSTAGKQLAKETRTSKPSNNKPSLSSRQKKKQAMLLLDEVLANADKINPVEYSILIRVEAANVLWQSDKEQSVSILKGAIKTLRGLLEEEKQSQTTERTRFEESNNLRFLVLRKIAAMNPTLITELAVENSSGKEAINGEWTPEARAVISIATDQIQKAPELAAQLAEQSMSLGLVDWVGFLENLNSRDSAEAERLAIKVIDHLRDSSITPLMLSDLARFVLNHKP